MLILNGAKVKAVYEDGWPVQEALEIREGFVGKERGRA
jgi:hypothetical protein